jgi:4-amino-4-deoxy-L-arabinose transferase-like glycosyltransferase
LWAAPLHTLFGLHEWTARPWSALSGLLGVVLPGTPGDGCSPASGLVCGGVLGSSLMYVVVGHLNTLDMGLTLFLLLALCGFLLVQRPVTPREATRWMHVAWAYSRRGVEQG